MEGHTNFNPASDIPSLKGRFNLITGGTGGLGRMTVAGFAPHKLAPHLLHWSLRSQSQRSDRRSQRSCPKYTSFFCAEGPRLIRVDPRGYKSNCRTIETAPTSSSAMQASWQSLPVRPKTVTRSNSAPNHMGHTMLVHQILPILLKTAKEPGADVRIISNTSTGFKNSPSDSIEFDRLHSEQDLGMGGRWDPLRTVPSSPTSSS